MSDIISLRQWRIDSHREPQVRIGVVLEEDRTVDTEIHVPAADYELSALDGNVPVRSIRSARVRVQVSNDGIKLIFDKDSALTSKGWRLAPKHPMSLQRGQGVRVRDIVAGRGFHWQKHVDQTLPGQLELLKGTHGKSPSLVLVNSLPLETYLAGVITAEMSGKCPIEFLRAQCITARSWLLAMTETKHPGQPFDRCNDDCCQRYQGTDDMSDVAIHAAHTSRGIVLVTERGTQVVDANYSKSCGGIVEDARNVWGASQPGLGPLVDAPDDSPAKEFLPVTDANLDEYLDGRWLDHCDVYCSPAVVPESELGQYLGRVDVSGHYFRWTVKYSHDELLDLLRRKLHEGQGMKRVMDLRVTQRGVSGRAIAIVLKFLDKQDQPREIEVRDQYRIREVLHPSFLFSSAFAARIDRDKGGAMKSIILRGAGWGHGVGLCQIGALGMAIKKIDAEKIVKHYYPHAELKRVYE